MNVMQMMLDNIWSILLSIFLLVSLNSSIQYHIYESLKPGRLSVVTLDPIEEYICAKNARYDDIIKKSNDAPRAVNKNNFTIDFTPLGNIIMRYDEESKSFYYYANRAIPYRVLEGVAKKYVTNFGCIHLYQHMETSTLETQTTQPLHKTYAKLKPVQSRKIVKQMNRYHLKGSLSEFKFIQPHVAKKDVLALSYSDFKKTLNIKT